MQTRLASPLAHLKQYNIILHYALLVSGLATLNVASAADFLQHNLTKFLYIPNNYERQS